MFQHTAARRRLVLFHLSHHLIDWFQHTAARRRLAAIAQMWRLKLVVSTHSRPKAAGKIDVKNITGKKVSTHSRPKAAGELSMEDVEKIYSKFQHTAARRRLVVVDTQKNRVGVFQHTAARRRLGNKTGRAARYGWFQHTAARRRLGFQPVKKG